MPNSPALDAKVTVVADGRLFHAAVCGHQFKGSFQWVASGRHGRNFDGFSDDDAEGVDWAHGWLPEYTAEARALVAAHKLARSAG